MLMQGTHMFVPTTKPAYCIQFKVLPLLWLQATRYGALKEKLDVLYKMLIFGVSIVTRSYDQIL